MNKVICTISVVITIFIIWVVLVIITDGDAMCRGYSLSAWISFHMDKNTVCGSDGKNHNASGLKKNKKQFMGNK